MSSRQLEPLVVFLDESIDVKSLAVALSAAGVEVKRATELFPRGTPDETWLAAAGQNGWVVLTRDRKIRYRELERLALTSAGVKAFVFTGGNCTIQQTIEAIVPAVAKMRKLADSQAGPFIYHLGKSGNPTKVS